MFRVVRSLQTHAGFSFIKRRARKLSRTLAARGQNLIELFTADTAHVLLKRHQEIYRHVRQFSLELPVTLACEIRFDLFRALARQKTVDGQQVRDGRTRFVKAYRGARVRHRALEFAPDSIRAV